MVPMSRTIVACAALLVLAGCAPDAETADPEAAAAPAPAAPAPAVSAPTAEQQALAAQIRTATQKYKDVKVAEAEGYMADPTGMCVSAAMVGAPAELGAMGIHYFRPDLLGIAGPGEPVSGTDAVIDPNLPEVLVYEPAMDGTLQLVAAEYLVFQDAWKRAGNTAPPSLAGQAFAQMADNPITPANEAHGFTPHHELHVWVHRDNPTGLFAEFNPAVTCDHARMKM
jgi:hypothetical protein